MKGFEKEDFDSTETEIEKCYSEKVSQISQENTWLGIFLSVELWAIGLLSLWKKTSSLAFSRDVFKSFLNNASTVELNVLQIQWNLYAFLLKTFYV